MEEQGVQRSHDSEVTRLVVTDTRSSTVTRVEPFHESLGVQSLSPTNNSKIREYKVKYGRTMTRQRGIIGARISALRSWRARWNSMRMRDNDAHPPRNEVFLLLQAAVVRRERARAEPPPSPSPRRRTTDQVRTAVSRVGRNRPASLVCRHHKADAAHRTVAPSPPPSSHSTSISFVVVVVPLACDDHHTSHAISYTARTG